MNIFVFCAFISVTNAYQILFLSLYHAKSHEIYLQSFVKALLKRGHHVTHLTHTASHWQSNTNYTEILIDPPFDADATRKSYPKQHSQCQRKC